MIKLQWKADKARTVADPSEFGDKFYQSLEAALKANLASLVVAATGSANNFGLMSRGERDTFVRRLLELVKVHDDALLDARHPLSFIAGTDGLTSVETKQRLVSIRRPISQKNRREREAWLTLLGHNATLRAHLTALQANLTSPHRVVRAEF